MSTNQVSSKNEQLIISFLSIRKAIGILGIALPLVLLIGTIVLNDCQEIQGSISAYYYTDMRNVLVGILSAVAFYLFSYRGYDKKDRILSAICGLASLGVAFLPTSVEPPLTACVNELVEDSIISTLHFVSAGVFFLMSAYISIVQFTKGSRLPTPQKLKRNNIYRLAGIIMILSIAVIVIYITWLEHSYPHLAIYKPVFWLETFALWAFGISWLVKGEFILEDS